MGTSSELWNEREVAMMVRKREQMSVCLRPIGLLLDGDAEGPIEMKMNKRYALVMWDKNIVKRNLSRLRAKLTRTWNVGRRS